MWNGFIFFWFFLTLSLWGVGVQTAMVEFLFFAMGAFISFILSFFLPSDQILFLWLEILVFFLSSFSLFILFYKKMKNSLKKTSIPSLNDTLQGATGVCTEPIKPNQDGSIFCEGSYWKGRSHELISVNERVQIIKKEGLTLIVKKIPN